MPGRLVPILALEVLVIGTDAHELGQMQVGCCRIDGMHRPIDVLHVPFLRIFQYIERLASELFRLMRGRVHQGHARRILDRDLRRDDVFHELRRCVVHRYPIVAQVRILVQQPLLRVELVAQKPREHPVLGLRDVVDVVQDVIMDIIRMACLVGFRLHDGTAQDACQRLQSDRGPAFIDLLFVQERKVHMVPVQQVRLRVHHCPGCLSTCRCTGAAPRWTRGPGLTPSTSIHNLSSVCHN